MSNCSGLYAIYLRKSRADLEAEARGAGETLKTHRRTLIDMASVRGLTIGEIYEEIVSGDTISARPQMQRLLADLEAGKWAGVLVMDVDRLGRGDSIDQGIILKTFKYSGAKIITVYKEFDPNNEVDEEFFEFNQQIARSEYRRIKRRMLAGRVARAREGKYQSPKPPFGYEVIKLKDQKGNTLIPIQDQADAVRMIFRLYAEGENGERIGMDRVAHIINSMGFSTYRGKPFARSEISTILRNPVYIGKIRWNQRKSQKSMRAGKEVVTRPRSDEYFEVNGLHQPIISLDVWNAVQARLAENTPHKRSDMRLSNPFAGLMVCALCGKTMLLTPVYNRPVAGSYRCRTAGCKTSGADIEIVERAFLSGLQRWLNEIEQMDENPQPESSQDDINAIRRRQLTQQLATLHAQQDRLHDLLEQEVYDVKTYLDRNRTLNERIKSIQEEVAAVSDPPSVARTEAIRRLKPQIENVLHVWRHCGSAEDKNELIRTVVSKIIYNKTRRCYRNEDPGKYLTLDLLPISLSKLDV